MADENKPAFYPRVGNIKAKNFKPAQPLPFVNDPRAMDLPQYGDLDLSVPNTSNLDMARRIAERDAQIKRQQDADTSPLEKAVGALQAVRFMGSAMTQAINSIPTRLAHGDEAAEKFMQERMYTPNLPKGLEYAGDVGEFLDRLETQYKIPPIMPEAVALQHLTGPATSQAKQMATKGAMSLEKRLDPLVTQALERGGLQRDLLLGLGQGTQSNVIKPKDGNWLTGGVEKQLNRLKMSDKMDPEWYADRQKYLDEAIAKGDERAVNAIKQDVEVGKRNDAISDWIDSNLTNYVKKQMATPEDPVRKLAEEGVLHIQPYGDQYEVSSRLMNKRSGAGFPPLGMGKSEPARFWERQADISVEPYPAGSYKHGSLDESILRDNPWLQNVPDETMVNYAKGLNDLGFDHVIDVLRQDVREGRIRPEQLNKVSMEQAVRRTHEYDQQMAKRMREAAIKNQEGFPVHKEYPEGYKWIELAPEPKDVLRKKHEEYVRKDFPDIEKYDPYGFEEYVKDSMNSSRVIDQQKLADALKYEGNTMGHCVGGYCPDVVEGKSRIFSLRDTKGEPHVTVEVQPSRYAPRHEDVKKYMTAAEEEAKALPQGYTDRDVSDIAVRMAKENAPQNIIQIKGKQNAKPKDEYLPYVQDFVRSGKWGDVGDFKNTGLTERGAVFTPTEIQGLTDLGQDVPTYLTKEDIAKLRQARGDAPPTEGMKRGGVAISKNPDTMMLELNDQKMKNGVPAYGAGKAVIKEGLMAAKPPKVQPPIRFPVSRGPSIPEIRAMAERMAPQVMGEFVRAAPTPSAPKPSTSVVGKTQKQFEREKTLPIEYENIKPEVTPEEFDYAKKKGALLIGAAGDVTPANRMLLSIDQQPLSVPVHMQAGPEWELYNPTAWAASDQMAKTYMKRAGQAAEAYDADPYLHYHKMTPDANYYAMHHFNSLLSHLRPEELKLRDPKLYQQMVEEIRTKDVGYGKHPDFEGFEDPLNLQIHAQIDPNFRRHIGALFNGPKFTQRYGLNSGQDVLAATSLPELRDLEAGASGYAVVPLDVKAPLRNFEAESQTYDTGFPKAGPSGRSKYPSPYQLIYRDTLNWMKEHPSENKSSEFGRMNMIVPKQQIDDELIDAIGEYQRRMKELTGKKKGGSVKKAEGGAITGDDLIIEERPL